MDVSKILGGKKCNEEGYYCTNKKTPLGKRGCKSSNTGTKSKICECLPMGNTYRCGLVIKNKKSQNYKIIELEKENKILKHKLNETKKIIQRLLSERRRYTPKRKIPDDFLKKIQPENYSRYQDTLTELKKDKKEFQQNLNLNISDKLDRLKKDKKKKNEKLEELQKKIAKIKEQKRKANI